eukprot:scaffold48978_cov33-Tisochrysis_lutea.AAC.1
MRGRRDLLSGRYDLTYREPHQNGGSGGWAGSGCKRANPLPPPTDAQHGAEKSPRCLSGSTWRLLASLNY